MSRFTLSAAALLLGLAATPALAQPASPPQGADPLDQRTLDQNQKAFVAPRGGQVVTAGAPAPADRMAATGPSGQPAAPTSRRLALADPAPR